MQVRIKKFDVAMEIKYNGIEIDVSDPQGHHLGDLVITKTKLIWCQGRTRRRHGKAVTWAKFIEYMSQ